MIPNHKQFIEAIEEKKKVCLRFYSRADAGVIDLVCAPMDYAPGPNACDDVNRYWFWDYTSNTGSPTLGLLPEQVLDLRILGQLFDPADFSVPPLNVLAFPHPESAKAPRALIQPAPSAPAEQQLNFSVTDRNDKAKRSHTILWKNTNPQTKTT